MNSPREGTFREGQRGRDHGRHRPRRSGAARRERAHPAALDHRPLSRQGAFSPIRLDHDLYQDLRNLRDHPTQSYSSTAVQAAAPVRPNRWIFPLICAACALLAAAIAYMLKPAGQNIGNYRYTPLATDGYGPVWSPDGKAVAYSAQVDGVWQLFERYLTQAGAGPTHPWNPRCRTHGLVDRPRPSDSVGRAPAPTNRAPITSPLSPP